MFDIKGWLSYEKMLNVLVEGILGIVAIEQDAV